MHRDEFQARVDALMRRPFFARATLGVDFFPGWLGIIEALVAGLESLPNGSTLRCAQMKEKFGTLRVYLVGAPPRVDIMGPGMIMTARERPKRGGSGVRAAAIPLVRAAEERSAHTCMVCGAPGAVRWVGDWLMAVCDCHAASLEAGGSMFD